MKPLNLSVLPAEFTVVRIDPGATASGWALGGSLYSVTGTVEELSIVCESHRVPNGLKHEPGWRALKVEGPLDFTDTGILAVLTKALAEHGISVFVLSTYDTDYILVKNKNLQAAIEALSADPAVNSVDCS
jgi:hypothetical protein